MESSLAHNSTLKPMVQSNSITLMVYLLIYLVCSSAQMHMEKSDQRTRRRQTNAIQIFTTLKWLFKNWPWRKIDSKIQRHQRREDVGEQYGTIPIKTFNGLQSHACCELGRGCHFHKTVLLFEFTVFGKYTTRLAH